VVSGVVSGVVLRDEARLPLRHGGLSAQALGPLRRPGRSTAEAAGPEHVVPRPPLLGVGDSVSDHDLDETVLDQVQKALLLRDLKDAIDI
jgi:hypothetical protein